MPYLACVMQFPLIARVCSGDEHAWILKVCHYCNHPCRIKIIWSVLWPWKCYLSWTQVVWLMNTSKQISQCVHSDWLYLSNFLHSCKHVSVLIWNFWMWYFWLLVGNTFWMECICLGCVSCEFAMRRTSFSVASVPDWPCSFPLHSGTWSFNKLLFFTYFPGASVLFSLIHHSS